MTTPEVIRDPGEMRDRLSQKRKFGETQGLVPTMGALHAGHAALLRAATRDSDVVTTSIFVNPLQFDRKDDLEAYPRTMEHDLQICADHDVDYVFAPTAAQLYREDQLTFVESPSLSTHLCGAFRPGHFRGVATVVLKLINIVQPDLIYFGEKDAQQLAIIRRMVKDLNLPTKVIAVPTIRESDGLALSSRNARLSPTQRTIAPVLAGALCQSVRLIEGGERRTDCVIRKAVELLAEYPEIKIEYFQIVQPERLVPVEHIDGPVLIAAAIWVGSVRLIDNMSWPVVQGS